MKNLIRKGKEIKLICTHTHAHTHTHTLTHTGLYCDISCK